MVFFGAFWCGCRAHQYGFTLVAQAGPIVLLPSSDGRGEDDEQYRTGRLLWNQFPVSIYNLTLLCRFSSDKYIPRLHVIPRQYCKRL